MATKNINDWLMTMYADYTAGQGRKETMFGKSIEALGDYADIFRPGGEYGAGVEALLGRGKKRAVAGGMQSLVSAGLAGTTMPMHLEQTFEEEIGMPTRMRSEDIRMERLGGALGSLGQMYASYDPGTATIGDISQMATTQASLESRERATSLDRIYSQRATRAPYVSTAEKMAQWKEGRISTSPVSTTPKPTYQEQMGLTSVQHLPGRFTSPFGYN